MDFDIGDFELEYVYDYYHPLSKSTIIRDNLKLPESLVTLNVEDENNKIEDLLLSLASLQWKQRIEFKRIVFLRKQLKADALVMLPRCCLNLIQRPMRELRTHVVYQKVIMSLRLWCTQRSTRTQLVRPLLNSDEGCI
ncbi:hypothetical protein CEXT_172881 [Caerostris extrusa]|uniref:Uncharacterized protein n=1 Tax=Caerostris extrusa TaxID=172846 RepID=A0AAV4NVB4_CAEEX|nr:hypothetical protein CEXT_172881 [Caerostris extrusa]